MKPEPTIKREVTHWPLRPFVMLVTGFFVFMALMFAVLGSLTKSWTHGVWPPNGPVPSAQASPGWNTAAPQVQPDPSADLALWQQHEYEQLNSTRWNDHQHAYATIPIDKAMDLVAASSAAGQLDKVLPAPKPATPIDLQNQKAGEAPKSP